MDKIHNNNSKKLEILLVEDDFIFAESLKDSLEDEGFNITLVKNGSDAIKIIKNKTFPLIISDINLPKKSGIEILEEAKKRDKLTKVILITGYGSIEKAVEAMKKGAEDFITKPFNMEEFLLRIKKILKYREQEAQLELFSKIVYDKNIFYGIVGKSKVMEDIFYLIETIADSDANVLITGESGTGKELVANAIQMLSNRKDKPFIKINCAAIPENLIESELFGYEKGAFTGAIKSHRGKFLIADKGTLFLDEIGELPLHLQTKLLRVIEDKTITPLGSNKSFNVDVRIISATQQNLEKLIEQGKFRQDLYYRLKVVNIHIPPLRDRREDIPILIDYFIEKFSKKYNRKIKFTNRLINELISKDYPGNVRELENLVHSIIVVNKDREIIDSTHFSLDNTTKEEESYLFGVFDIFSPYHDVISKFEKIYLSKVLKACNNKKTLAAEILKISRKNLWEKLKKHNLG